jgi:flagella basal body P-ring formation protein FlgA
MGIVVILYLLLPIFALAGSSIAGLNDDIKNELISYYKIDTNRCKIEIRKNRFKINPDEYDSLAIFPLTGPTSVLQSVPRGLVSLRVELYKNNLLVKKGQIRVKIEHFDNVLVSLDRIGRHDIITSDKYIIKRTEITSLTDKPVTSEDALSGKWAKRNIGKGQILSSRMFEIIPTISFGQEVSILYKKSYLKISVRGTALQTGSEGDLIKVRNNQSKKIIACTVINDETVRVASH